MNYKRKTVLLVLLAFPLLNWAEPETFEPIYTFLNEKHWAALEQLRATFPNVPADEWECIFERINRLQKLIAADLAIPNESEGLCCGSVFPNDTPYLYENLPAYVLKCLKDRKINPEKVLLEFGAGCAGSTVATHSRYTFENDTLESHQEFMAFPSKLSFDKTVRNHVDAVDWLINFRLLSLFKSRSDALTNCKNFHFIEWIIQREITHIAFMHHSAKAEIYRGIRKYYAMTAIENTAAYLNYCKILEYYADIAPCIRYPDLAKAAFQKVALWTWLERFSKK
ncbi:hypothetical protein IPG37_03605 [bacterium]|nr:MAG: hypothetical protein IPG37_03605 [bacterium]